VSLGRTHRLILISISVPAPGLLRTLTEELAIVREQLERYVQERQSSAV
jgi:hypothetical protein